MELALIKALIAGRDGGLRAGSGYKAEVWHNVVTEVSRAAGYTVEIRQCKNKHDSLKADYRAWIELIIQPIFEKDRDGHSSAS
ncbi:hypothetical protein GQ44DRAFT_697862 [Phaeosphaeriaceae sp. PMI808]|nr:hypothetical protein GQ44DRAFT_697862 [Phaeosphaeriaceae sp. PMI808]